VNGRIIKYIIDELGEAAATQTFLWKQKNAEITVENYFKEHYGIDLKLVC
jgi:UTP-glucose-1-phosphate uridylyltransferase